MAVTAVTARPLVVTLEIDAVAQDRFERERAEFFPPERTKVGAHVTLFHALPGSGLAEVVDDLSTAADRAPFPLLIDALASLGRGVAYRLASSELSDLHRSLQKRWWDTLTSQDRQGLWAHVTVQNKVEPAVARAALGALRTRFAPFRAEARGLLLWRYDGGPWTALRRFPFPSAPEPRPGAGPHTGGVRVPGVFGTDEAPDPVDRRRTAT